MKSFEELQEEIIILNKNGVNFLVAASICWLLISLIWLTPYPDAEKAYFTFFACAPMMPLALLFSKLFRTKWKIENNPLNTLGLWLNFAQLFYFPFVFILLGNNPVEMPMALAIVTGAHFFPYAWFYKTMGYAVMAGILVLGSTLIGTSSSIPNPPLWVALLMAAGLWVLALWSFADYRKVENARLQQSNTAPETAAAYAAFSL